MARQVDEALIQRSTIVPVSVAHVERIDNAWAHLLDTMLDAEIDEVNVRNALDAAKTDDAMYLADYNNAMLIVGEVKPFLIDSMAKDMMHPDNVKRINRLKEV